MNLTEKDLQDYFFGRRKSPIADDAIEHYNALRIHFDGEYPEILIGKRRPHESEYLFKYRKEIYKAITKETTSSVLQSLGKIRRSTDWSISYNGEMSPKIADGESLEDYCEKKYPYYTSLTNWVFSVLIKTYLIDPNALILIKPLMDVQSDTEYLKPYPFIFNSDQVIDYKEGEYAILLSSKKRLTGKGKYAAERKQWYVVTNDSIITYAEDNKGKVYAVEEYSHGLGYLPIVPIRAVFKDSYDEYSLYESRLSAMLPRLDEAVREYSDQQANIVNHLFPERWEYASQPCADCRNDTGVSTGMVRVETGKGESKKIEMHKCNSCGGSGVKSNSGPYSKFIVQQANTNMGEQVAPIPPFGYVTKDVEVIKTVDTRIEFHQYKALCSINMQFLMATPLNQSGFAKEVDRDELNNFVYSVAEDIVAIMDRIYKITCDYRYSIAVPEQNKRNEMLPKVAVPEKYDILSSTYLADEVKAAKDSKLNGVITSALELEYCSKKFYNNPEIRDEMRCVIELDPMVGATEDEKMVRLNNGGVTKPDYILSCNIVPFVKRAIQEEKGFLEMQYQKQMEIVKGYADAIIAAQKASVIPVESVNPPVA